MNDLCLLKATLIVNLALTVTLTKFLICIISVDIKILRLRYKLRTVVRILLYVN